MRNDLKSFLRQDEGAIAVITALLLTVCIGFAALAIDVGLWYSQKTQLQMAADAGAVGGAWANLLTGSSSVIPYATYDVSQNTTSYTTLTVNTPPHTGTQAGNKNAVEVILTQVATLYLSGLFLQIAPTLTARAVAMSGSPAGCLTLLGGSGANSHLTISGNDHITANSCKIVVNSTDSNAISISGNATLTAQQVSTPGGVSGSSHITTTPTANNIVTGSDPAPDPFANISFPTTSGCSSSINITSSQSTTVNPGSYCSFSASGSSRVTMNPGVYYIYGGNFSVSENATLSGEGVTVVMTGSTPSSIGSLSVSGTANTRLSAPTSGATAGFIFMGDRTTPNSVINKISQNSNNKMTGIIYFPTSQLSYTGNADPSAICLQVIAYGASLSGDPTFNPTCTSGPSSSSSANTIKLVE